jgi:hypothetical protein
MLLCRDTSRILNTDGRTGQEAGPQGMGQVGRIDITSVPSRRDRKETSGPAAGASARGFEPVSAAAVLAEGTFA